MGADETVYESVDPSVTTEFVGYDSLNCKSKITVLTTETEIVEALSDGEVGTVIVNRLHSMLPWVDSREIRVSSALQPENSR